MAKFEIPKQKISYDIPELSQFFRDPADIYGRKIYQRVGNEIKAYDIFNLAGGQTSGEHARETAARGQQLLKSQYGVDFASIPTFNLGDVMGAFEQAGAKAGDWSSFQYQQPAITSEIRTNVGGQPTLGVAPQVPYKLDVSKPYYRVEGTNEVYDSKTGQHITAEQAKTIPDFWKNVETTTQKPTSYQGEIITPETLNQQEPIDTGKIGITGTTDSEVVAGAKSTIKSIDDYVAERTRETATSQQVGDLTTQISSLLGQTAGKTAMLAQEEEKAGVNIITSQLKNIQNEIAIKSAEYEKLYADIQGKPITMSSIIGAEAQARKMAQADIRFLQAQSLALQNNLSFAQQTAQKAVDNKYNPIEEELRIKSAQLQLLQPQLSKEEKIQSQALEMFYNDEKQRLADQKATEKQLMDYTLKQMDAHKDAGIRIGDSYDTIQQKILNSPSYKASIQPKLETIGTSETGYYSFNPATGETKKLVGAGITSTPIEETGIDGLARALNAGTMKISNVPEKLRTQVISKAKDFALEDLKSDIQMAKDKNDYGTREQLFESLRGVYPEFSKDEIARWVYELISDQPQQIQKTGIIQATGSFFKRLFGF